MIARESYLCEQAFFVFNRSGGALLNIIARLPRTAVGGKIGEFSRLERIRRFGRVTSRFYSGRLRTALTAPGQPKKRFIVLFSQKNGIRVKPLKPSIRKNTVRGGWPAIR